PEVLQATPQTMASWPPSTVDDEESSRFHTRATLSRPPVTRRVPSGLQAMLATPCAWPRKMNGLPWPSARHTRASPDAVASRLPSRLQWIALTTPVCDSNSRGVTTFVRSQYRSVRSSDVVTR